MEKEARIQMNSKERDETAVLEPVTAILRGADERQWEKVRDAFAPRVVLDYGVPELLQPHEIVAGWEPLFAGFDRTRHEIQDAEVRFAESDRAQVTASFVADHWLAGAPGGDHWRLGGRYELELVRTGDGWKVSRMRMIPQESSGNGKLPEEAGRRGGAPAPAPPSYRVEHARFSSASATLTGLLHLPNDAPTGERLPAVIVMGSWTTVKEQMPRLYAQRLAAAGFAALTMDFRGFGESGGAPRHGESPARKVEDIRATVDFLSTYPAVDPQRIGLVGVCASSGYAALEAVDDPRVRSVVMIAPWLHDAPLVEAIYGSREVYGGKGVDALMQAGREARERFERNGTVDYVPGASATDPRAAMYWPDPSFLDYYLNAGRGGIPQWGNRFAVMSWPEWLGFDALASAPRLRVPALIVHSEEAAIPDGAKRYAAAMPTPPKMVWMNGTQWDFYDDTATVDRAAAEAVAHLRATLRPASS
jgi:uncharacterized protein